VRIAENDLEWTMRVFRRSSEKMNIIHFIDLQNKGINANKTHAPEAGMDQIRRSVPPEHHAT
jgi:hypothetical protein